MYRPLIYSVCYGDQTFFDCLSMMLESLNTFGQYKGDILVITDREEALAASSVPAAMRNRVKCFTALEPNEASRYRLRDFIGAADCPILQLDTDIICATPIEPVLRKMSAAEIYGCSEAALLGSISDIPASAVADHYKGNYFGLDLFLSDPALREMALLCLNSGLFGFGSRGAFESFGDRVNAMYVDPIHADIRRRCGDQPFFNFQAAKRGGVDTGLLSSACSLVPSAEVAQRYPRPFVHFLWAKGADKAAQMANYLDFLKKPQHEVAVP